jgi:hypothetical protein
MVISLSSATQTPRRLKIKRVISETQMHVGEEKTKINEYADISAFLIADTAIVSFTESQRPVIDLNEIQRQVYEEEPTVALRGHAVDWLGRSYSIDNPLPVGIVSTPEAPVDVTVDGEYREDNLNPDNVGLIAHQRDAAPTDAQQTERLTSVKNGTSTSLDVNIRKSDGTEISVDNPLEVRLSDGSINIGSVNAELEVALSHMDNTPDAGDVADSVRIGDGVTELAIDPLNRSISVNKYEKLIGLLTNANWMNLGNFDQVIPLVVGNLTTLDYYEDGYIIGQALFTFNTDLDWNIVLKRYINDDDGSWLQDDDDTPFTLN